MEIINKHPQAVHFVHINAQSLLTHFDYFMEAFLGKNIHVIAVSETWLNPCINSSQIELPNYEIIRSDRAHKNGGGVALYIRNDIKHKLISTSKLNVPNMAEFVLVELTFGYKKLLFSQVYRPPNAEYISDLENELSANIAKYDHVILAGDININLLKTSSHLKKFNDTMSTLKLTIINTKEPTHVHSSKSEPTLLDVFACSDFERVQSYGQIKVPGFSHHDLIFISYLLKNEKRKPKYIEFRDYKNIDIEKLREDAAGLQLSDCRSYTDVDDAVRTFTNSILQLYDKHAPIKTIKVTHKPAPWRTQEIKELEARRDAAYEKYRRSKNRSGLLKQDNAYFEEYRVLRNKTNQVSRNAKIKYSLEFLNPKQSSKVLWRNISKTGLGKQKQKIEKPMFSLEEINNFFSMLPQGIDLNKKAETIEKLRKNSEAHDRNDAFILKPVPLSTIKKHFKAIKTKAIGHDLIGIQALHPIIDIILPSLTKIINMSIIQCKFPTEWKKSNIIPL